jgi:ubiquinone/menaquinone biosynthesis C-methylase UbiE
MAKVIPTTLNLGAGNRIAQGAINHDVWAHRPEINSTHDLNVLPWPWPDDAFKHIEAWAVLEHLQITLIESLGECWRVLRPGGMLRVKLPFWNVDQSYADPTHRWFFSLRVLDIFDPDTPRGKEYSFYTERKWRITRAAAKVSCSAFYAELTPRKNEGTP